MAEPAGTRHRLLIVEDDPGLQRQMRWCFDDSIDVTLAATPEEALAAVQAQPPQVITLDLGLPPDPGGASAGFALLGRFVSDLPDTKVIVITGREEHEHAVRAIGGGAHDFYQKPVDADTLAFVVARAFRHHDLEQENARLQRSIAAQPIAGVITGCDAMQKICRLVERVAPTDLTVLIGGETGTGKEVFAKAVHALSPRAKKPMSVINCAAIPENLLESELFGYEAGAFTGATRRKEGRIELADGSTLFLDELGDMPLGLQAKILRFLQERVIERVGGRATIPVDVRVICATHRDLRRMVAEGQFREDLFYRVSEISLVVPPLRERPGDAVLLARAFLARYASEVRRSSLRFDQGALAAIEAWQWPGNVRELENRVKRGCVMADGSTVTARDLELAAADSNVEPLELREVRDQAERRAIARALARSGNNIRLCADLLGVTRPTLYNLLAKHNIAV
jgi:two-component system NtrC family response regulator